MATAVSTVRCFRSIGALGERDWKLIVHLLSTKFRVYFDKAVLSVGRLLRWQTSLDTRVPGLSYIGWNVPHIEPSFTFGKGTINPWLMEETPNPIHFPLAHQLYRLFEPFPPRREESQPPEPPDKVWSKHGRGNSDTLSRH